MSMKQTKEQFVGVTYDELLAENAKLWELGKQYELVIADYGAEVAKLRELCADMWPHVRYRSSMCASCELPCDASDECLLYEPMRRRMRELGVEVDE